MQLNLILGAAVLAGACGCHTVNTYDPAESMAEKKIIQDKRIITDLGTPDVVAINENIGEGGLRKVQVELLNRSSRKKRFSYRFEWFDKNGMLIDSPSSVWVPVQMEGKDRIFVSSTASTPNAADFRLRLQESTK